MFLNPGLCQKAFRQQRATSALLCKWRNHPLEYGSFEGVIPAGNYGAGTVMLWDCGTYEPLDGKPGAALEAGKLSQILHGKKLNGHWSLIKLPISNGSKRKCVVADQDWGSFACFPARGRNIGQIGANNERDCKGRQARKTDCNAHEIHAKPKQKVQKRVALPATNAGKSGTRAVQTGENGCLKQKLDGIRAIAVKDGQVRPICIPAAPRELGPDYPEIVRAIGSLPAQRLRWWMARLWRSTGMDVPLFNCCRMPGMILPSEARYIIICLI